MKPTPVTRRQMLSSSASAAVATFFLTEYAFATVEEVTDEINSFTGGKDTLDGTIVLTIPEIAENGHSVPISVSVTSPMTEDDHVESIMILAESNPNPVVVTLQFTELSGEANVSTRIRLAETQHVVAVAKMSDGSFYKVSNHVRVTIGGCGV